MSDQGKSSQALTKYFEEHFRPERLKGLSAIGVYKTAIRQLTAYAGHAVTIDSVTEKMISRFAWWIQQRGNTPRTAKGYCRAIRAIVRYAYPHKFPKGAAGFLLSTAPGQLRRRSLRRYFEEKYRPKKLPDFSRSRLAPYLAALNKLSRFCCHDVTINELTPKLFQKYRAWLTEGGLSPRSVHLYCLHLADIRRDADPDGYDKFYGQWPTRKEMPQPIPAIDFEPHIKTPDAPVGSLLHYLHHVYLPSRVDMKRTSMEQLDVHIRIFDRWHGRYVMLDELTDELVVGFMRACADKGLASSTVNDRRRAILTVWKHAYKKRYVDELWRDIPHKKEPRRIPEAWTLDELRQLLAATDKIKKRLKNQIWLSEFWRAYILVGFDTGLRASDMLALRTTDLKDDGSLLVTIRKTGVEIIRPLKPESVEAIRASYPPERDRIFDWPYGREMFSKEWRYLICAAGFPNNRRNGSHKLRRTSASYLDAVAPGTAGRHLGHLTPGLAERFYVDPRVSKPVSAAALLPSLTDNGKGGAA